MPTTRERKAMFERRSRKILERVADEYVGVQALAIHCGVSNSAIAPVLNRMHGLKMLKMKNKGVGGRRLYRAAEKTFL